MPIAPYLLYLITGAFSPGPNNVLAMSTGTRFGFRRSLPLCRGMLVGQVLMISACVLFSSFIYNLLPGIDPYLRVVGALYILYLAWGVLRSRGGPDAKIQDKSPGFAAGLLVQCLNVKYIVLAFTALASFILPHSKNLYEALLLGLLMPLTASSSNHLWALCGSAFQKLFARHGRVLNAVMAVALVYCAASILGVL